MKEIQFILYNLPDDEGKVQAVIKDETIWLTQKAMAALFDVGVPAISKHLNNIYEEGELSKEATVSKMEIVQEEGTRTVKRSTDFYNLDAIISVGYRVNSVISLYSLSICKKRSVCENTKSSRKCKSCYISI